MADTVHERWDTGDAYEQFMGRWSQEVASRFLKWLNLAPGLCWLDVGCGTGALTREIAATAEPKMLIGLDPSLGFVQYANQRISESSFLVADDSGLAMANDSFDMVVSGLALNFMPQSEQVLMNLRRIVRPGGTVAAYVWDYAGKMEFLRYFWDAAVALDPTAEALHEGNRFPICQPEPLLKLWQSAGFQNVIVEAIDILTVFATFEDYWHPFTLGNFPAPNYAMSISKTHREQLKERLQNDLANEADKRIQLIARVWAVCGTR